MSWARVGLGLAIVIAIGFGTVDAQAQTATDLKCRKCVGPKDIGKKAVKSKHIKDGQVKTLNLSDGAITTEKMSDGAVTTGKLSDGAVTVEKLDPSAKATATASRKNTNSFTGLTATATTVQSVNVDVTGPGAVTLIYSVAFFNFANNSQGYCYINPLPSFRCVVSNATDTGYRMCSGVETIEVSAAGNQTFDLMCVEQSGDVRYLDSSLTALHTLNAGTINNTSANHVIGGITGSSAPPQKP